MEHKFSDYYSPSQKGFYSSEMDELPQDSILIAPEYIAFLLEGQSEGKCIMPPDDSHELPWLEDQEAVSQQENVKREKNNLHARLKELDASSVRPLRAIVNGEATEEDLTQLRTLEAEAAALREELKSLQ